MTPSKASVQERAARYQRRYTGPFRTVEHEIGPVVLTTRYRRRLRIEWAELAVAGHDLWKHAITERFADALTSTESPRCSGSVQGLP